MFLCVPLMTISSCLNFHKNPSCLKVSRTLLKNDDTLLEFRRMWRFLIGAGVLDHVFDVPLMTIRLSFKFEKKSIVFEGVKNSLEE